MSSNEAQRRSWSRLRRSHLKKVNNPAVREWEEIDARNHFGPGVEKAVLEALEAMRRRRQ
jgi:hypothetical protein